MGCQVSVPEESGDHRVSSIGKTERSKPRIDSSKPKTNGQLNSVPKLNGANGANGISRAVSLEVNEEITNQPPKLNEDGHLEPEEVVRRTSSSLNVSHITVGSQEKGGKEIQISYAYRSQRGYYPDDPMKANQDKYGITLNFSGEAGDAMFAVYDGHGTLGHEAASFAKKKLPQVLAKHIRQKRVQKYMSTLRADGKTTKGAWNPKEWPILETDEFESCCKKSFIESNKAMHTEKSFDDKLCGTTAAAVVFHGGRMTVCNVGDSRVLLGHRIGQLENGAKEAEESKVDIETELSKEDTDGSEGDVLAIPLTSDQTPYRRDERERVQKQGAEVKSIDQMQGRIPMHDNWGDLVLGETVDIHGDPPRIWATGKDYPGTAFTRSLGDRLAEDIGVIADPEVITTHLTHNDQVLVIASDGIFEFLTNQYVMSVCSSCLTPLEACETLTQAAYDQWLVHENRTDDITIIVCFLDALYKPTPEEEENTTEALAKSVQDLARKQKKMSIGPSGVASPEAAPEPTLNV